VIQKKRFGLVGIFILSDVGGILISYFYSYLFRFYAYIIPVDPNKGIPPFRDYVYVFPLFLAIHLFIFYLQGFYKTKLKRTKIDDFLAISLNAVLTILAVFAILSYLYSYSQGPAPLFRVNFKISHVFLVVYFIAVIFMITFLRTQIYFFMKRRYARGLNLQNVLIVGAGEMGRAVAQKILTYKDLKTAYDRVDADKVEKEAGELTRGALRVVEPSIEDIRKATRFYLPCSTSCARRSRESRT
jgi:FlaA1/EpsC-like NDP-sugar epimerase